MNRVKILYFLKRYHDSGFRIDSRVLRFLERENIIGSNKKKTSSASSEVAKFWNPRLKTFEIKVYIEGREDKRSTRKRTAAIGAPVSLPAADSCNKKQKRPSSSKAAKENDPLAAVEDATMTS